MVVAIKIHLLLSLLMQVRLLLLNPGRGESRLTKGEGKGARQSNRHSLRLAEEMTKAGPPTPDYLASITRGLRQSWAVQVGDELKKSVRHQPSVSAQTTL